MFMIKYSVNLGRKLDSAFGPKNLLYGGSVLVYENEVIDTTQTMGVKLKFSLLLHFTD